MMKVVLPLLILAGAVAGAVTLYKLRPEVTPKAAAERAWPVATVSARVEDAEQVLRVFGQVVPGRDVELRPLVAGPIVAVGPNFAEGGVVAEDELLVAIDPFEYEATVQERTAEVTEAEARLQELLAEQRGTRALLERDREQVELREREVARRETLLGSGASTTNALEESRLALNEAQQRLQERERSLATLEARIGQQRAVIARQKVALARATRDLAQTELRAPFAGFLVGVDADLGKRLGVGDRVARLIDAERLDVRFHLSSTQYGSLLDAGGFSGRPVKVYWRAVGKERPIGAVIDRVEGEMETASGGVSLYARLDLDDLDRGTDRNSDQTLDRGLRPGAFVAVAVSGRTYRDVVRLPETALQGAGTAYAVVDGRLDARSVDVVARSGSDVFVRGEVAAGDVIATTRFPQMASGVKVVPR